MSLTRKGLKAMGLTEEQVDSIIEAHSETVDALKERLTAAEADAQKLATVQKELDDLKAAAGKDGFEEKYRQAQKAYEDLQNAVNAEKTKAAKEAAAKSYFEGKNITGANLEIAMRAAAGEIAAIELDGDKIKDTAALDALTSGTLAGLAGKTAVVGAQVAHPPVSTAATKKTKEEIFAIKDTAERQKAIAANLDLFGY